MSRKSRKLPYVLLALIVSGFLFGSFWAFRESSTRNLVGANDIASSSPRPVEHQPSSTREGVDADLSALRTNNLVTINVLVIEDESERPLEGVDLRLYPDTTTDSGVVTDDGGRAVFALPDTFRLEVIATRADLETCRVEVSNAQDSHSLVMRMRLGGAISGRVSMEDGTSLSEPAYVVAVPAIDYRAADLVIGERAKSVLRDRLVVTDSSGIFRITGLRIGTEYVLQAASRSAATNSVGSIVRASVGAIDVELVLYPVVGAILQFSAESPEDLSRFRYPTGRTRRHPSLQYAFLQHAAMVLAGLPTSREPGRLHCKVFLFSPTQGDYVSTVSYSAVMPGFEPLSIEFNVEPPKMGKLPVYEVKLVPTATGWGSIEITMNGAATEFRREHQVPLKVVVYLDDVVGNGQTLSYSVMLAGNAVTVEDVPEGRYLLRCNGFQRAFSLTASEEVVVSDQEVAKVLLDEPELGYVRIHVLDEARMPVQGTPAVRLADGDYLFAGGKGKWWDRIICRDNPYQLALKPGMYSTRLEEPYIEPAYNPPQELLVVGGVLQDLVFVAR